MADALPVFEQNEKRAAKFIRKQLKDMELNAPYNVSISPSSDNDLFHCQGIMLGPIDSPYENGIFHLKVDFPEDYPFKPMKVRFLTKIFNPNVFPDGLMCIDILQDQWSPSMTIRTILVSIISLLFDPDPNDSASAEIAHCYRSDLPKYNETAREWTRKYARDEAIEQQLARTKDVIAKELNIIQSDVLPGVTLIPMDFRQFFQCRGTIMGPQNSPYEGRRFLIDVQYPLDYPKKPPRVTFLSYIYHLNIERHKDVGAIFLNTQWNTNMTMVDIFRDLLALLANPNPDRSISTEMQKVYQTNREHYNKMAREKLNDK